MGMDIRVGILEEEMAEVTAVMVEVDTVVDAEAEEVGVKLLISMVRCCQRRSGD